MNGERLFSGIVKLLTLLAVSILGFIIVFIALESMPAIKYAGLKGLFGFERWNPVGSPPVISILPMIVATVYVSLLAVAIALPVGVGSAVFLSCIAPDWLRKMLRPFIDIMAGIPSVVYGFIGLIVVVGSIEDYTKLSSGESMLAGGIILAIMTLPYIVSTCDESMVAVIRQYEKVSKALGISRGHMIGHLVLPGSKRAILAGMVLSFARASGETMAVMMVIGNSPIFPRLMGKSQTIPSLIALEMGGAQIDSIHYHALFAAGLVLMIIRFVINMAFYYLKKGMQI